jgi:predicted nucleic acid-binding protein
MSKFVLDTVVLRVFAFAHPQGIDILLTALNTPQAVFPSEVFNLDEDSLPPNVSDENLSELARGLRYARRQVQSQPGLTGQRFQTRLENAIQVPRHINAGSLFIEPLKLEEIPMREQLMKIYGIGRGEASCLILAKRETSIAILLSSDEGACRAAQAIGIAYLTIPDILTKWVRQDKPTSEFVQDLIDGMKNASFSIPEAVYQELQRLLEE